MEREHSSCHTEQRDRGRRDSQSHLSEVQRIACLEVCAADAGKREDVLGPRSLEVGVQDHRQILHGQIATTSLWTMVRAKATATAMGEIVRREIGRASWKER